MAYIGSVKEETVELCSLVSDDKIEKERLSNGDRLVRSCIGETLILTSGMQIMLRPGYFSLSSANGVSIEKTKDGMSILTLENGDELMFNDRGIQSLRRGSFCYQFLRQESCKQNRRLAS